MQTSETVSANTSSNTLNNKGYFSGLLIQKLTATEKIRLRPIPVLGIGIGPIPVVSVWYWYRRYCSRYQNRYQSAVTPL